MREVNAMLVTAFVLCFMVGTYVLDAADRDPQDRAIAIWGDNAETAVVRIGPGRAIYQVGCYMPTRTDKPDFQIAAEGSTWDEAFSRIDLSKNGKTPLAMTVQKQPSWFGNANRVVMQCQPMPGLKP